MAVYVVVGRERRDGCAVYIISCWRCVGVS